MGFPKARQVVIPDHNILYERDFQELQTHAINSAKWYADNGKTKGEVRVKLLEKGYREEMVSVIPDIKDPSSGKWLPSESINPDIVDNSLPEGYREEDMITTAIRKAEESYMFTPEDSMAKILSEDFSIRGKSSFSLQTKLKERFFSPDIIEDTVDRYNHDLALEMALERIEPTVVTKVSETWEWEQKVKQRLTSRGFSYNMVSTFMSRVIEERNGDPIGFNPKDSMKNLKW